MLGFILGYISRHRKLALHAEFLSTNVCVPYVDHFIWTSSAKIDHNIKLFFTKIKISFKILIHFRKRFWDDQHGNPPRAEQLYTTAGTNSIVTGDLAEGSPAKMLEMPIRYAIRNAPRSQLQLPATHTINSRGLIHASR